MDSRATCHHCNAPVGDSPFALVVSGPDDDWRLPLCRACQELRQNGQLPVDLLVQQWAYGRAGSRGSTITSDLELVVIQLDCLGCGGGFSGGGSDEETAEAESVGAASARRLPDGSLSTVCPACRRTNVLERRGGQLVAVRLW
jgi:hypothetical protein